jgi:LPXTG-motif cell wall-anchored protein
VDVSPSTGDAVLFGLILIGIVVVVAIPGVYLAWRFQRGEEAVPGGSDGAQLFGRTKDSGPE